MAESSSDMCVVCSKVGGGSTSAGGGGRFLGPKGRASLIQVSQKRNDGALYEELSVPGDHFVHDKCYKSYTAARNISREQKTGDAGRDSPATSLRSEETQFDYQTHCLICAQKLDFEGARRHPERSSTISNVEMVSKGKTSILQENLMKKCDQRNDDLAINVKARVLFAGDIRALEAKYHRNCMQMFLAGKTRNQSKPQPEHSIRNLDLANNEAFSQMCAWLLSAEQRHLQHTLSDLRDKLSTYLPKGVNPYSTVHIKRRLLEHFGKQITIAEVDGRANVVTLKERAASILHESYIESAMDVDEDTECIKQAKFVGSRIRECMQSMDFLTDVYPAPTDTDINSLENDVPQSLLQLTKSLLTESRTKSAKMKKKLLQLSLCHVIMQASGKQSYISPLLLSVGLFIHQQTRSRVLLDVLSSLGLSVSYDQVIAFEKAAVVGRSIHDLPPGLVQQTEGEGFCQWVADNFDYNEDTLTGHDTTHVMGVITCQTPRTTDQKGEVIPRRNVTAAEIVSAGDFGDIIRPYKPPATNKMADVNIKAVNPVQVPITRFEHMDTLWLCSSLLHHNPPNWQGFMSKVEVGTCQSTAVIYNPMIPLNPQTNEAVYSTMAFVLGQAKKMGMCCATLTLDQPLYLKAYKIKQDNLSEFQKINIRLGGFHQLMSFLGAIGKLMEGSGLEDLWTTVYARNSLPKMIEGKAYTKALRACLLADAALHLILVDSREEPDDDIDANDEECIEQQELLPCDLQEQTAQDDSNGRQGEESVPVSAGSDMAETGESDVDMMHSEDIMSLKEFYDALMSRKVPAEHAGSCIALQELCQKVQDLKANQLSSRTGKLWLMFMRLVSIVRMFIRAERTGNWVLHLWATQEMLPYFAAAGHNNYTRCCRLYLQDCQELCPCLDRPMKDGLFTIHRNEQVFWSGTWTDMTIEQCLMRAGKTHGGLINITHKEAARTKWLLSAHVTAQYCDALRALTGTSTGTWSEQHREMTPGCRKRDFGDLQKFVSFLRSHNPFSSAGSSELRNISSGLIADDRVNVDEAKQIGTDIHNKLTGKRFGDIVLKRSDQARTFNVMRKPVRVENEDICMSSAELQQRLLSIAYVNGPPDQSIFTYELATVAPSLFQDDGSMRKSQKSQLAQHIMKMSPNITEHPVEQPAATVIDGCALLYRLAWPKVGTVHSVCESYVGAVIQHQRASVPLCVVFDSYKVRTTKDSEQKRRRVQQASFPDMVVEPRTSVPTNKTGFLSNVRNKQNLVNLLGMYLRQAGIQVTHAGDEGDADVVIVRKALDFAEDHTNVCVLADDTDILILLMYHSSNSSNICLQTKAHVISIKVAQEALGRDMCRCLPFAHAMSGCDTTSALFGIGKVKVLKVLQSAQSLRSDILIFGETGASPKELHRVGEQFVAAFYKGGSKAPKALDELRYLHMISPKYVAIERMPPTSRACYFHCLRVHHQVSTWRNLRTVLSKEEYGFKLEAGSVVPIITDMAPAPSDLLREIRCSCKSSKKLCASCSCAKKRLPCSIHCKCEGQCENFPPVYQITDETDDDGES